MWKNLPWIDKFKPLGNTITNDIVLTSQDICVKRAQFITKTIEICQEFWFACSRTKCDINQLYNSHFTGSPLWDLFGKETHSLESSYNLAIKNMYDLPISTHRHLIGPISNRRHLRITLISRFLSFIEQLRNTDKAVSRMLFYHIQNDVQSPTGRNLRNILLLTDKNYVEELRKNDADKISYHETESEDIWKEFLLKELVELRDGISELDLLTESDIRKTISDICIY